MFVVGDVLRWNRRRHPHRLAAVDADGRMTHAQLVDRAWGLARGLLELGVRKGDTVAVLTGNSNFAAETYLGVVAAGAVAVPLNWRWALPELVFGLNDCQARVALVESDWANEIESAMASEELEHLETVILQGDRYDELLRSGPAPQVSMSPDDASTILYTGGTTGFPKGVLLTHRNVLANALNEVLDTDMEHDDVTLLVTPMFHSASLLCWFLPHVLLGATSVFLRAFDEQRVADVLRSEGVTNGFLVPSMVRRLLSAGALERRAPPRYRRMYVGGGAFHLPDKEAVRAVLPDVRLYYQYGLTEAGPIVTRLRPEDMFRQDIDGSVGQEFLLTEVAIKEPTGDQTLDEGQVGELCVRGPNVMAGYFRRPEATEAVLRNGWLRTGDAASQADEGFFYLHDRLKDMIKSGGENVYSQEVEHVLYAHPAIQEVAVIGVPSEKWDEEVRAVVCLRPGQQLSEQQVRDHCRAHLAGYKVPKSVAFLSIEQMPINPSGKILKTELRQRSLWEDVAT